MPVSGYALLAVALIAVPFGMTVLYLNNVLVLQARVEMMNRAALLGSVTQCLTLAVLAFTGHLTVAAVVAVWAISMALPLIPILLTVRPRLAERDLGLARRAIGLGVRMHPGVASLYLLYRLDVIILNAMTTPAVVGLYTAAVTIAELTRIVTDTLAQVSLPDQVDRDNDEAVDITVRTTRLSAVLALTAVGGLCLVAPFALPLVYGSAFADSVPALLTLAPGMIALGATRPVGNYLLRLCRPGVSSTLSIVAVVLNVGLNLLLIPRWGMIGCSLASSIGYTAYAAMQVIWFAKATGTPWHRLLPGKAEAGYLWRLGALLRRTGVGSR
jgi:O-antigen/teichoic acid export membrane protein